MSVGEGSAGNPSASLADGLIGQLVADLAPVRPLPSPLKRAMLWIGAAALLGVIIALWPTIRMSVVYERLSGSTDIWLAALGSMLTAILAAIAAFELSLPDRRRAWALLPLPALALWIGASGLGCLRGVVSAGLHVASLYESMDCLAFIASFSIPLSALMVLMLRRGYSLRPGLTGAMGGLAAAAAAATLLNLCHPFDASVTDLSVHAFAVATVILVNRASGGRLLAPGK